ncbi:hypothetical protein O3M35_000086 [Rhynocoris fuscipes]|uniref:C2H2-type domain-containing protein n=1 Tax=Rhynocoris fuscipes TaxID=488301 RepID=A0AAW1DKW1_9HEMI
MNLKSNTPLADDHSKAVNKRSLANEIVNAEDESEVEQPPLKSTKTDESISSKPVERAPPRFLDSGYSNDKFCKNKDKGKVIAAVTLSARKKSLSDYLDMLVNLKNNELSKENNENIQQQKLFLCCACPMRFKTYKGLRNHIERPTSRLLWRCTICWLSFETRNVCQVVYHAPEYHINDLGNSPEKIPIELIDAVSVWEPIKMKEVCPECRKAVGSIITHLWYSKQKDPGYHCPLCNTFFTRNVCRYNLHIRMHKNTAPFRCPDCAKLFDNCTDLLLHLNKICRHVQQTVRYKCSICELIFYTEIRLKYHIYSDHNSVKYKCHVCSSEMNITSEKNLHYSEKHTDQILTSELRRAKSYILSHSCAICGESGLKGCTYERHVNKHFNNSVQFKISIFQCNCSFITNYRGTYLCHKSTPCITNYFSPLKNSPALLKLCYKCFDLRFFNGSEPFLCERCEYRMKDCNKLFYSCLLCKKLILYAMEHFLMHLMKEHRTIDLETAHKHVRKFTCFSLDEVKNDLDIIEDTVEDSSLDQIRDKYIYLDENNKITISDSHTCTKCDECFTEKNLLRSHYLSKHRQTSKHNPCLECGESFKNLKSLSEHLQTHGINNSEVYLKKYGINYGGGNHDVNVIKDCHISNDFICPVCDKIFSTNAKKTQHMRSHGMLFLKKLKEM